MNVLDSIAFAVSPQWALKRARARLAARHYEAASRGRRTKGWSRTRADVNRLNGVALHELRMHARDLVRNNAWARKAQRVIANNTIGGWGLNPSAVGPQADLATQLWRAWADSTDCDVEGRRTFSGIQHQVMRSFATDGEVLIRRRWRRTTDKLALPFQIQIVEADHLDTSKTANTSQAGGPIIHGVEFDKLGRRAAYWLHQKHPGGYEPVEESKRVPAEDIIHVFDAERPWQARGPSLFGAAIVALKDLDEHEDAELMKQKIAACFAAFVTDDGGSGGSLGEESARDPLIETLEPGMINYLAPGQQVQFGTPPQTVNSDFTTRNLRRIASALGVTYEDLTGDYSQVNFSSARMARLSHWGNIRNWQWNMLVPQLCQGVWRWAMEAAITAGALRVAPEAKWTAPPMPMIEPDKEGLAYQRLVRNGVLTFSDMIREQGEDPEQHFAEYAEDLKRLDRLGLTLDSDVRKVSSAGQLQQEAKPDGASESEARILGMIEETLRGNG